MRAIARRPAHLARVTHEEVQHILRAEDAIEALMQQGARYRSKLEEISRNEPDDIRQMSFVKEQLYYVLTTLGPSEPSQ